MLDYDPEQASFSALVGSLATQAMFALGLIAAQIALGLFHQHGEQIEGNLSGDESKMLLQTAGELEQAFAVRVQQFQEQAMRQGGAGELPPIL